MWRESRTEVTVFVLSQGTLIKRQLIPKDNGAFFDLFDLNVGREVTFFGKTFRITTVDEFTRRYLLDNGAYFLVLVLPVDNCDDAMCLVN